jgi:hypothetical protein
LLDEDLFEDEDLPNVKERNRRKFFQITLLCNILKMNVNEKISTLYISVEQNIILSREIQISTLTNGSLIFTQENRISL